MTILLLWLLLLLLDGILKSLHPFALEGYNIRRVNPFRPTCMPEMQKTCRECFDETLALQLFFRFFASFCIDQNWPATSSIRVEDVTVYNKALPTDQELLGRGKVISVQLPLTQYFPETCWLDGAMMHCHGNASSWWLSLGKKNSNSKLDSLAVIDLYIFRQE